MIHDTLCACPFEGHGKFWVYGSAQPAGSRADSSAELAGIGELVVRVLPVPDGVEEPLDPPDWGDGARPGQWGFQNVWITGSPPPRPAARFDYSRLKRPLLTDDGPHGGRGGLGAIAGSDLKSSGPSGAGGSLAMPCEDWRADRAIARVLLSYMRRRDASLRATQRPPRERTQPWRSPTGWKRRPTDPSPRQSRRHSIV